MLLLGSHSGDQTVWQDKAMTGDRDLDPKDYDANPAAIAHYLTEVFEKNDLGSILEAIKFIMRAQNVKALAEATGMRRDGLYKTFAGKKDPQLSRVLGLFQGLDVRIVVKPLPATQKAPRPKLGRPLSSKKPRRDISNSVT
jgi:probable addiction module antidote protein